MCIHILDWEMVNGSGEDNTHDEKDLESKLPVFHLIFHPLPPEKLTALENKND